MTAQVFLIAPQSAKATDFVDDLDRVLNAAPVAALLLPRGARSDEDYAAFVEAIMPLAQARNCAVLLEDMPELAKRLGADGVHMSGGVKAFRDAAKLLHPGMIVGAGNLHSRHDAMEKAEAGADYLFFGDVEKNATAEAAENAAWWAQTFETPCVLLDAGDASPRDPNIEFVAFGDDVWSIGSATSQNLAALAGQLLVAQ